MRAGLQERLIAIQTWPCHREAFRSDRAHSFSAAIITDLICSSRSGLVASHLTLMEEVVLEALTIPHPSLNSTLTPSVELTM